MRSKISLMLATQKGRSKPVRISLRRSEKVIDCVGAGVISRAYLQCVQSLSYFFGTQPSHSNHFIATALAGRNGNGITRNPQKFCKEFDAGFIRPAVNRRGS